MMVQKNKSYQKGTLYYNHKWDYLKHTTFNIQILQYIIYSINNC